MGDPSGLNKKSSSLKYSLLSSSVNFADGNNLDWFSENKSAIYLIGSYNLSAIGTCDANSLIASSPRDPRPTSFLFFWINF